MLVVDWKSWISYVKPSLARSITMKMLRRLSALRELFRARHGSFPPNLSSEELSRSARLTQNEDGMFGDSSRRENGMFKDNAIEERDKSPSERSSLVDLDEFFDVPEPSDNDHLEDSWNRQSVCSAFLIPFFGNSNASSMLHEDNGKQSYKNTDDSEFNNCGHWVGKWDLGTYSSIAKSRIIAFYMRGLGAVRDLKKGELVLKVPRNALMTTTESMVARDRRLNDAVNLHGSLSSTQILTVCLLYEMSKGKSSFWHPYMVHLPRDYDLLATFGEFEKQALQVLCSVHFCVLLLFLNRCYLGY